MTYAAGVPRIPAAALSPADAQRLERMAARGKPVVVRLSLENSLRSDATAWNVSGDLPGTGDEVVVIGGHLDSWDPGTGAVDDGTGVAITTAAARLVGAGHKRTLRVVMFGAEEMGFSGGAYLKAHTAELPKIVLTGESDSGPDLIWKLALPKGVATHPSMSRLAAQLAPLTIPVTAEPAGFGGSDTGPMTAAGVPTFAFSQDTTRYFDLHHSADDTLDKVDPAHMAQNVAAWAVTLSLAADADIDFRKP
jgi:Zn-dependent M28 family amino/carboxypeptidase